MRLRTIKALRGPNIWSTGQVLEAGPRKVTIVGSDGNRTVNVVVKAGATVTVK